MASASGGGGGGGASGSASASASASAPSRHVRVLLDALAYPLASQFSPKSAEAFRALVAWLEDLKIRLYPPPQRAPLRDIASHTWNATLIEYLVALEYDSSDTLKPANLETPAVRAQVTEFLLREAVANEYADKQDEMNKAFPPVTMSSRDMEEAKPYSGRFANTANDAVREEINTLAREIGCYYPQSATTNTADACARLLSESRKNSAAAQKDKGAPKTRALANAPRARVNVNLNDMSSGIDAQGDADDVVKLLRLLHLVQLRGLQTEVDRVLAEVQALTADPRTDAALGKVGT